MRQTPSGYSIPDANPSCEWIKRTGGNNNAAACYRNSGQWCIPCQIFFGGASPTAKPLTARTVTDAQILELHTYATSVIAACNAAVLTNRAAEEERELARERCAEIINDRRHGATK